MPKIIDILDTADLLKAHLEQVEDIDGVAVIVNRQKDLENELSQTVAGLSGAAVIIEPVSGSLPEPSSATLQFDHRYVVSLWSQPILSDPQAVPASRRLVSIIRAVHHWRPALTNIPTTRMQVQGWSISQNESYLIYAIDATLTEIL